MDSPATFSNPNYLDDKDALLSLVWSTQSYAHKHVAVHLLQQKHSLSLTRLRCWHDSFRTTRSPGTMAPLTVTM